MKNLYTALAITAASSAQAQLINGSFEVNGGFSLQGWEWGCDDPQAWPQAAPGGGDWSAWKEPGHAKGCFPAFLYQRIPNVQYGVPYQLSGWVKCPQNDFAICLGGSLAFGVINTGDIIPAAFATSNDTGWTFLTTSHVFDPGIGDTAIVILSSGFIGGPINPLPAGFDQITLDLANSVDEHLPVQVSLFPDPATERLNVGTTTPMRRLEIFDATGRAVMSQAATGTTTAMDVSALVNGAYILRATTSQGMTTRRFSKR
jgi:Secretion system C-terminal sorting domain